MAYDEALARWLGLALGFVQSQPAKKTLAAKRMKRAR